MADPAPFAVDPLEAIDYLRSKLRVPTATWTDIWQDMHARAFVVAGAQSDALLADFHEAVTRAIAEGRTLEQFREDFDRIVAAHGWSYRGSRGWRSAVIFNTNLRMAYAAGRWKRIQAVKDRAPWLRYIAVMDERTRPLHRAWHNTVLAVDHPFWHTHFPPNGWNCRCSVQQLSDRDLARLGLQPSSGPPPSPLVPRAVSSAAGRATILVPKGIDPGFAYNPGRAAFGQGQQSLAMERHGRWQTLEAPFPPPPLAKLPLDAPKAQPGAGVPPGDAEGIRRLLREALGGDELIVTDPLGGRVLLSQAIADHIIEKLSRQDGRERFFPLMRELLEDPAEIWVGWARDLDSGRVALRRRYVKLVDIGGGRTIGLVADIDGSLWSGLTFFRGRRSSEGGLRSGLRIYLRENAGG